MDKTQFWQLIEDSRKNADNCEEQADELKALLLELEPQEIIEFNNLFDEFNSSAYRWDLWAAAYIINCGASDDGFTYFRWWLIAQGQHYFEAALQNVENAGNKLEHGDIAECEAIAYCSNDAFQEKTGDSIPEDAQTIVFPDEPSGTHWEYNQLETLFPRLCQKFG